MGFALHCVIRVSSFGTASALGLESDTVCKFMRSRVLLICWQRGGSQEEVVPFVSAAGILGDCRLPFHCPCATTASGLGRVSVTTTSAKPKWCPGSHARPRNDWARGGTLAPLSPSAGLARLESSPGHPAGHPLWFMRLLHLDQLPTPAGGSCYLVCATTPRAHARDPPLNLSFGLGCNRFPRPGSSRGGCSPVYVPLGD